MKLQPAIQQLTFLAHSVDYRRTFLTTKWPQGKYIRLRNYWVNSCMYSSYNYATSRRI